jgi:cell division protein FtsL
MALRAPATRRAARKAARPPLRVVKGGKRARKRSPIPIVVAVVFTVFGVVALHATISQDGLKAAKLEREVADQTERLTLMRARVAQKSNAARVANEADKLGLVADPNARYIQVPMDGDLERTGPRPLPPDPLKQLQAGAR